LNEKRKIEPELDPDNPEQRSRSDVAPKQKHESGAPARHISGLRPAVHLPATESLPPLPSLPLAPLTPADLLEDGWDDESDDDDDEDDSGPTLLDTRGSVPRELVAEARAISDPLGEVEPETREVATREVSTRRFEREEAPTNEMQTVQNPVALPVLSANDEDEEDDDDEFSHDDFPTRQTPMGFEQALLAFPLPSDSHRGLHETMSAPGEDSTPDLPSSPSLTSSPSLGPTVARPVAPVSPRAMQALSPLDPSIPPLPSLVPAPPSPMASSLAAPMPNNPDETAQMPCAPALPQQLPPSERSSVSQISQVSHPSQALASHSSQGATIARPLMYPTPTSISGTPLPPANTVRFAFLRNLSPNNDPPISKLFVVASISFFATLALSAFVAWVIVLVRH
jgi:hypothetical protein